MPGWEADSVKEVAGFAATAPIGGVLALSADGWILAVRLVCRLAHGLDDAAIAKGWPDLTGPTSVEGFNDLRGANRRPTGRFWRAFAILYSPC